MEEGLTCLRIIVSGRVQGVGYRWFVKDCAARLGITGWVQNRPDGTVAVEAQGQARALGELRHLLETGHPYARVDKIEEASAALPKDSIGFEII